MSVNGLNPEADVAGSFGNDLVPVFIIIIAVVDADLINPLQGVANLFSALHLHKRGPLILHDFKELSLQGD